MMINQCKDFVKPLPFLLVTFVTCSVVGEHELEEDSSFPPLPAFPQHFPADVDGEPWRMWHRPPQGILMSSVKSKSVSGSGVAVENEGQRMEQYVLDPNPLHQLPE